MFQFKVTCRYNYPVVIYYIEALLLWYQTSSVQCLFKHEVFLKIELPKYRYNNITSTNLLWAFVMHYKIFTLSIQTKLIKDVGCF